MMQKEDIINGGIVPKEDIVTGTNDKEGWCMSTLQKGGIVQQEGIIKGRDEDIINGRDDAGGQYKREGWCTRRTV